MSGQNLNGSKQLNQLPRRRRERACRWRWWKPRHTRGRGKIGIVGSWRRGQVWIARARWRGKVWIESLSWQGRRRQTRSHAWRRSRRWRQSRSSWRSRRWWSAIEVPSRSAHRSRRRRSRRSSAIVHHRARPSRCHAHTRPSTAAHHAHVSGRCTAHTHAHATTTSRRGRKSRPDPRPLPRLVIDVELGPRHLIVLLSPPRRQRRYLGVGPDVSLLGRRQPHGPGTPLVQMLLVVQFEVLPELPSSTLLLPSSGGIMREVGVGIVVEEAGHGDEVWKSRQSKSSSQASKGKGPMAKVDGSGSVEVRKWPDRRQRNRPLLLAFVLGCFAFHIRRSAVSYFRSPTSS